MSRTARSLSAARHLPNSCRPGLPPIGWPISWYRIATRRQRKRSHWGPACGFHLATSKEPAAFQFCLILRARPLRCSSRPVDPLKGRKNLCRSNQTKFHANAKSPLRRVGFPLEIYCRRSPNLPHTYACSTIGPASLNFRVRDGNGWDPRGMVTGKLEALTTSTTPKLWGRLAGCFSRSQIPSTDGLSRTRSGKLAPSSLIFHNEIDWVHYRAC